MTTQLGQGFLDMMTNKSSDPFAVVILAKKNLVATWSCETENNALVTINAYMRLNPQHHVAKINGKVVFEQ